MNNFVKSLKENYLYLLLISGLAFLFYAPYLFNPEWGLLDDGVFMEKVQNLSLLHPESFFNMQARSIPVTWLFTYIIYHLADYHIGGIIFLRFLELLLLLFLTYYFINRYQSKSMAALGAVFILFTSAITTNFYELGTQDHITLLLLFFFLLFYPAIISSRAVSRSRFYFYSISSYLILLFLIFTKEINFFIVPVFLSLLVYDFFVGKDQKKLVINAGYLFFSLVCLAAFYFANTSIKESVSGGYSLGNVIGTMIGYIKMINFNWLAVLYLLVVLYNKLRSKEKLISDENDYLIAFFALVAFWSFVVYLPWGPADRYLVPSIVFFYIVFFSTIGFKPKKIVIPMLALVFASNLFFSAFHAIRFYGMRIGESNLLGYLVSHKNEYDQICMQGSGVTMEDIIELSVWLDKVDGLNKEICTLAPADFFSSHAPYLTNLLDSENIIYGDKVKLTEKTLVAVKNFSAIDTLPFDKKYLFIPSGELRFTLPDIHPTRGFEIKEFSWVLGSVKNR